MQNTGTCRVVYLCMVMVEQKEHNTAKVRLQSRKEELSNALTHGIGTLCSILGLLLLLQYALQQQDSVNAFAALVYGSTLLILYLSSTLYHACRNEKAKQIFHIIDHAAIFLLIAGTYSPLALIFLRKQWGWTVFLLMWGIAVMGIVFKIFFIGRLKKVSLVLYLFMGWFALFSVRTLLATLPQALLLWILTGGVLYSAGVVFYVRKQLPYQHSIWHLFVLAGSLAHFIGIYTHLSRP